MTLTPTFQRGFLASLFIHSSIVALGLLWNDGSKSLTEHAVVSNEAHTIEIHLSMPKRESVRRLDQKTEFKPTPTLKPEPSVDIVIAQPEIDIMTDVIPEANVDSFLLPGPEPSVEYEPIVEYEPSDEHELIVERKIEQADKPEEFEPILDEIQEPIEEITLAEDTPSIDVSENVIQIANNAAQNEFTKQDVNAIFEAEMDYRDKVIRLIESQKFYPKRLQKMRKEGEVLIEFTLYRNGKVHDVAVIDVKGSALFKDAALKAVQSVAAFPAFPAESSRKTWSFRVPLNYQLLRS